MAELLSYIDSSTYPMVISCYLLFKMDKTISAQKEALEKLSDKIDHLVGDKHE